MERLYDAAVVEICGVAVLECKGEDGHTDLTGSTLLVGQAEPIHTLFVALQRKWTNQCLEPVFSLCARTLVEPRNLSIQELVGR